MSYQIPTNSMPSKIIYIDSRDASNYLAVNSAGENMNSYFQYILKENIEVPSNMRMLISLNSATIPYSFYNIREGVNDNVFFEFENKTTGDDKGAYNFKIPAGNYSVYSFSDKLKSLVKAKETRYSYDFLMDFNTENGKFWYQLQGKDGDAGDVMELTFLYTDILGIRRETPHIEMGFTRASDFTIYSSNYGQTDKGLSLNVVDINGSIHGVYIRSNLVSDGTLDSQNGTFSNILARLPINVASGGVIFSVPSNNTFKSIVDLRHLSILTIRLTDERNRILDLNGLHFQIAISLDFVYGKKQNLVAMEREGNGDSYAVETDKEAGKKILTAQQKIKQAQKIQKREARRRGVGRPRRVGRPRGTTNLKKMAEEELYQDTGYKILSEG